MLRGGVGNQLFQLCAGLYYSLHNDADVILDFSEIHGNQHQGFNLADCKLIQSKRFFDDRYSLLNLDDLETPQGKRRELSKIWNRISNRTIIQNSSFGEDDRLDSKKNVSVISGYFQSNKYVDFLINNGFVVPQDFQPTRLSVNAEILQAYVTEKAPIILHVRSGDYAKHIKSIGIVGPEYYLGALSKIKDYRDKEVMLITDDKRYAFHLMQEIKVEATYFEESQHLHPLELIYGLSHAKDFVIPNSSFSWWAAKLSDQTGTIVCPKDWFREFGTPKGIRATNWDEAESSFIEKLPISYG